MLSVAVRPLFLLICYQSFEHDILKTNEPILLQVAHRRGKMMK